MSHRRMVALGALVLSATLGASGCSQWSQTHEHNTGVGPYVSPSNEIIEFPYGWDNAARVCVDGDGVYTSFHGNSVFVVRADPACPQPSPSASSSAK